VTRAVLVLAAGVLVALVAACISQKHRTIPVEEREIMEVPRHTPAWRAQGEDPEQAAR
jgi:hypothetical protein